MKTHILRPLYVVLALVGIIFIARLIIVPSDFGVWEKGYMYGWHRKANEDEWKAFPEVKFKTRQYCKDCHTDEFSLIMNSPHSIINCENCHGLAILHPEEPQKLSIDRTRQHCLRCHSRLPYKGTQRASIKGIIPDNHNPDIECAICHNPHNPKGDAL